MSGQNDTITIPSCPVCGQTHTYSINVKRSVVMTLTLPDEGAREVEMTRLFICPVKNEDFQATFVLFETATAPLESVEVINPGDELRNE